MDKTTELEAEVEDITWALIDDQATQDELRRLEELLLHSREACQAYVRCLQIEADLYFQFGDKRPPLREVIEERQRQETTAPQPAAAGDGGQRADLPGLSRRPGLVRSSGIGGIASGFLEPGRDYAAGGAVGPNRPRLSRSMHREHALGDERDISRVTIA